MRAILALAALLAIAGPVLAGPDECMKLERLSEIVERRWGEVHSGGGPVGVDGLYMMRVFVSPGGATWTIAREHFGGMACIVATGTDWKTPAPKEAR